MYILGISGGSLHDGSAALLQDGRLLCLIEQERLSRHKRAWGERETDAIVACLASAGIALEEVEAVAVGWNLPCLYEGIGRSFNESDFLREIFPPERFPQAYRPSLYMIPHHLAHAASALWTSGWERAAILVVDGRGESQATTIALGTPAEITLLTEWGIEESLGNFYGFASRWVGFSFMDAGKLMGLAAYGQANQPLPLHTTPDGYTFAGVLSREYRRQRSLDPTLNPMEQQEAFLQDAFQKRTYPFCRGDKREVMAYAHFAASVQRSLEQAMLQLAEVTRRRTGETRLVLAGGVAMNCSMNGHLARSGIFGEIFVPPVPFDAGVSLGAALLVHRQLCGESAVPPRMEHAYWAPALSAEEVEAALRASGLKAQRLDEATLIERVADHLVEGHTIGWSQGRAEIGQRALGARSILGDPRKREHLIHMNTLKGREVWRPLAPSVQAEYAEEVFAQPLPVLSNFMLAAWPIRPEIQPRIPAVVHVDGTARPQIVHRETSPRYWQLINAFRERTGVPTIINTSFNLAGEPIVYRPEDAIQTFIRSQLDVLVLDDFLVEKDALAQV